MGRLHLLRLLPFFFLSLFLLALVIALFAAFTVLPFRRVLLFFLLFLLFLVHFLWGQPFPPEGDARTRDQTVEVRLLGEALKSHVAFHEALHELVVQRVVFWRLLACGRLP